MGFKPSGSRIVLNAMTNSGGSGANTMVESMKFWLTDNTFGAGWTHVQDLTSEIRFNGFVLTNGNKATLNGNDYVFFTPPGSGDVLIGATLADTLNTWGALVQSRQGWSYTVGNDGTFTFIRFYNIPYPGNMLLCELNPTGTMGIWDYNPDNIQGWGRTWGGGHLVRSANVSGGIPLTLRLVTVNASGSLAIWPDDETFKFDGINVNVGTWNLLANKYQFFLMVNGGGSLANGAFAYAGHLYPSRALSFCNYITGPYNSVAHNDGSRRTFRAAFGSTYYLSTGSPFFSHDTLGNNKAPTIAVPTWGYGTVPISKFNNPLSGLPIIDDLGNAMVFDAFLAAPKLLGDDTSVMGWIWDALIYSEQMTMDSLFITTINGGKLAYPVVSQAGGDSFQGNSPGTLVVQRET